jgi:hypothetical protein
MRKGVLNQQRLPQGAGSSGQLSVGYVSDVLRPVRIQAWMYIIQVFALKSDF